MRGAARVQRLFDRTAEKFDTFYAEKKSPFKRFIDQHFHRDIFERFELTFQHAQPIGRKTVLDVGCGSGLYCIEFARRGARRVVGIDFAPKMLELARAAAREQKVGDLCKFIQAEFLAYSFREQFDYTVALGVFDYLREPIPFLQKMRDVTREKILISVPSVHWLRTPIRKFRYLFKRAPVVLYSRRKLEKMLREAGCTTFEIIKIPGAGMDFFVAINPCG